MEVTRICFVICPLGDSDSETRKRSDQVMRHIIEPAMHECSYRVERSDRLDSPGMITGQVLNYLVESPLVIADLSDHNANVFYELAVRHAIRKPFIQLMKRGDKLPFDVNDVRTVFFDLQDPDKVIEARDRVVKQATALELTSEGLETPISQALGVFDLSRSTKPGERVLGDLTEAIKELRVRFADFEKTMLATQASQTALLTQSPRPSRELLVEVSKLIGILGDAGNDLISQTPELASLLESVARHCRYEMLKEER